MVKDEAARSSSGKDDLLGEEGKEEIVRAEAGATKHRE